MKPGSSLEQSMVRPSTQCYIPGLKVIGRLRTGEDDFEGFHHIWAWRPSWSCDPDATKNFRSTLAIKAPHKNVALIGKGGSKNF